MKIEYNEAEKSIRIQDGAKYQFFLLKMSAIFVILTTTLTLYNLSPNHFRMMGFIWIFIGVTMTIMFFYIFRKYSYEENIRLDKILELKERNVFGKKRISLELTNGKVRDIITKNPSEISEIRIFFELLTIEKKAEATEQQ